MADTSQTNPEPNSRQSDADRAGRDKIANNIQNIVQQARKVARRVAEAGEAEKEKLAHGVANFAVGLQDTLAQTGGVVTNPYPGLTPYRLGDTELFAGRQVVIDLLYRRVLRGPFTVLHAEAGAGKSSLVQAGLAPRLIANGYLPLYLQLQATPPLQQIKRVFLADPAETPTLSAAPLVDFLHQMTSVLGPLTTLFIFLDQAEFFFSRVKASGQIEFVNQLADCLADNTLNVRWLFIVRSDNAPRLLNFQPPLKNPMYNECHFDFMTWPEARAALVEPAAKAGLTFEQGLVDTILSDLGHNQITPALLQVVASALYMGLTPESRNFTRATYDSVGTATGVLARYANQVLVRDFTSDLRSLARAVLISLHPESGQPPLRRETGLLTGLRDTGYSNVPEEAARPVLDRLIESHLVRRSTRQTSGGEKATFYLLAHRPGYKL